MIPIGENYKLGSDKYNIILYSHFQPDEEKAERMKNTLRKKYGDDMVFKDDSENWVAVGYYSSVRSAFDKVVKLELNKTGLENMQVVLEKIDAIYELIEKSCPNITVSGLKK